MEQVPHKCHLPKTALRLSWRHLFLYLWQQTSLPRCREYWIRTPTCGRRATRAGSSSSTDSPCRSAESAPGSTPHERTHGGTELKSGRRKKVPERNLAVVVNTFPLLHLLTKPCQLMSDYKMFISMWHCTVTCRAGFDKWLEQHWCIWKHLSKPAQQVTLTQSCYWHSLTDVVSKLLH